MGYKFVYKEEPKLMPGAFKCFTEAFGVVYAIMSGLTKMRKSSVDSWDTRELCCSRKGRLVRFSSSSLSFREAQRSRSLVDSL